MFEKTRADKSAEKGILLAAISKKSKGDTVTWEWMNEVAGFDIRTRRDVIDWVRNRLLHDYSLVLHPIKGVGYEILSPVNVHRVAARKSREHIRRTAYKTRLKLQTVDLSELKEAERLPHLAEAEAAHIQYHAAKEQSVKLLANSLNGGGQKLPLANLLDALKPNL